MLFNSHEFVLVFLPLAWAIHRACARISRPATIAWLCVASLAFYAWWDVRDLAFLLASIAANFGAGMALHRSRSRALLGLAIGANIALLAWFKWHAGDAGAPNGPVGLVSGIAIPLGVSFFTFTQIAYLADVATGKTRPSRFAEYLLFVSWFPHLVAGPLLRHDRVLPQFRRKGAFGIAPEDVARGLTLFALGLAKKVFLADEVALHAAPAFSAAAAGVPLTLVEAWVALLCYSFQIYFDFSAYSDMALGLSKMFGIDLPLNFDSPYRAASLADFWRRWHMSLSSFLRDYVYVPLGGNRNGPWATGRNLFATFLLGGLWHGIAWTFVAWGVAHGALLAASHSRRAPRPSSPSQSPTPANAPAAGWRAAPKIALTFLLVTLAWVPFRADSLATASSLFASLFGANGTTLPRSWAPWAPMIPWAELGVAFEGTFRNATFDGPRAIATLALLAPIVWLAPNACRITGLGAPAEPRWGWRPTRGWAIASGVLLAISVLRLVRPSAFLYFQF
ncbi:MAG: MBOAT family protein [Betaproteobacteria bacterium]|nr:MBOAT family protein [Betaproteobacteria bacterium]